MNIAQFAVGDTWSQTDPLSAYPASAGWVLNTRFVYDGSGTAFTITSSASGDDHVTTVAAATTAGWSAGVCTWVQWVEKSGEVVSIGNGKITFLPDPRTATAPIDLRTAAQIGLDNVRAVLRGTASQGVRGYSIAGRSLDRYSIQELIALESKLAADVKREQPGHGIRAKTFVRLGRA